jgi:hypothetical protein
VTTNSVDKYLLERPSVSAGQWESARHWASRARENLAAVSEGSLPSPTWLALTALAEIERVVFHGTSESQIEAFEPRQCVDTNPFGAQRAVYATKDPLWSLFYAALDRNPPFSLHNGCFRTIEENGARSDPKYFFSIAQPALERRGFSPGFIYVLPGDTFVREPESRVLGVRIEVDHWASLEPVRPLARIPVVPEDFPFLGQIRGHDDSVLWKRIEEEPDRFPWVDEQYQ